MRGGSRRGGQRRNVQQDVKNVAACICLKCGYSQKHIGGIPCRNVNCPNCGTSLLRGTIFQAQQIKQKQTGVEDIDKDNLLKQSSFSETKKAKRSGEFPQVTATLCTGCGTCVDACRLGAISLQGGVAVIDTEKCVNCRLCERLCPSKAIA